MSRTDDDQTNGRQARDRQERPNELSRAERDCSEAVDTLTALEQEGAIAGSDARTLTDARAELAKLRNELAPR